MSFIKWCNDNQGFVSALLSMLSILLACISLLASLYISRRQRKADYELAVRQEDLQKRQIKIDTYPYRVECFETLCRLKEFAESSRKLLNEAKIEEKNPAQIQQIFSILHKKIDDSGSDVILRLIEGENVFQVSEWKKLKDIRKYYDRICFSFSLLASLDKDFFPAEEKAVVKKERADMIIDDLRKLDELLLSTILAVGPDLSISDLAQYAGIYNKS